jgi:acetate kinase
LPDPALTILVVNAGSSTLKLSVVGGDGDATGSELDAPGPTVDDSTVAAALEGLPPFAAAGHRIVHGGRSFRGPVRVDGEVVDALRELVPLAPLHQPKALAALETVLRLRPDVPSVACFDTAFHAMLPAAAATYALPPEWNERFGLRRYGFHGLSHAHAATRAAELLGRADLRLVSCHLGAGASLTAIQAGRSVDTTMGFTPVEGLVMATRAGSVDPGLLAWLVTDGGVEPAELADALEHRSGLAGLAGTADMRAVLAGAEAGEPAARLALDVYVHRLRREIAAMAAAMDGLDALVFTGGVGERAPAVRAAAAEGLGFLGIELEPAANERAAEDCDIGSAGAPVRTLVIAAREDLEIARQVRAALAP